MNFFKLIKPVYFLFALAIGLFFVYIMQPKPEIVVKFPSPYNADKLVYEDKAGMCYKYSADNTACPTDTKLIKPQPSFELFKNKLL